MNVSIVKHTDTGEVKLFSGGALIGRYKSETDAIVHLSTALAQLTAAQQRVVELGIALREVSSAVGAGMGDGETVSNPDALAKAILEQVDTHIRISREAGRNEAQQRVAGYVEHIKQLEAEVEGLRAVKFRRFGNEHCWIYQGDGDDHLESLVCPVVMSAQQVMEFEKAQQRVAELEQKVSECTVLLKEWMVESAELLPPDKRLVVLMRLYAEDNDWIQCPQTLTGNIKSLLQLFDKLTADNARLRELLRGSHYRLIEKREATQ